jgi:glucokinase
MAISEALTTASAPRSEPARARAVFSTEDFKLLRAAVQHYLQEVKDSPESIKYANLYHRLGRLG